MPGVYIKSILPEKMKIKLIIVDAFDAPYAPQPVQYFLTEGVLQRWRYSPPECSPGGGNRLWRMMPSLHQ